MHIMGVRAAKILNSRMRGYCYQLFVRAARALLFTSSLKFGGVEAFDSKDRRIFSI
jgi:hypothetical protein